MASYRRSTSTRRRAARRTSTVRRGRTYARRRGTARRATRTRSGSRIQTVRIVVDTGQHSGASLGPSGMVKPAPKPRMARF